MKVKEIMHQLRMFNPEVSVDMRVYNHNAAKKGFRDFPINDVRITKEGIMMSNQRGVE